MDGSFDLFHGIYKYNTESIDTIQNMKIALDDVTNKLKQMERIDR